MNSTPRAVSGPAPRVRHGIASGQRYACTVSKGLVCLTHSTAWCTKCDAPRCRKHGGDDTLICAVCDSTMLSFAAITETERARHDDD